MMWFAISYVCVALIVTLIAAELDDKLADVMIYLGAGIIWPITLVARIISEISHWFRARQRNL